MRQSDVEKIYCKIVWKIASFTMLGAEVFVGTRAFFCKRLPISTVRMPASTKRIPANNTCVQVSPEGISNKA